VRIGSPILETKFIGVICNACWDLLSSIIGRFRNRRGQPDPVILS
jgi:hypothetical protein